MAPNELIKAAFDAGGGMMATEGLYVLEGNVKENTLKVTPMKDFQQANLVHFITNQLYDSMLMGIFNSEQAAEEHAIYLRTVAKDENGNIIP